VVRTVVKVKVEVKEVEKPVERVVKEYELRLVPMPMGATDAERNAVFQRCRTTRNCRTNR
jgi:hypothetical protein